MRSAWRIARIAGIDIEVHATFLLVVLFGAWQWGGTGWTGALFGVGLILSIFTCVALHELGHSLVAQGFGISVRSITLLPIGGVALLSRRPATPLQELLVSVAGPLVNVALAAALWFLAPGLDGEWWRVEPAATPSLQTWWGLLFGGNVALAAFNLVPAFPMDGGRMFRAGLSWFVTLERATTVAVRVGRFAAVGLFALGIVAKSPTLPLLAVFVFIGAGSELRDVRVGELLSSIRLGDAVNPYLPRLGPQASLGDAMELLLFSPSPAFAVEDGGRLLGVVTRRELMKAARRGLAHEPLSHIWSTTVPQLASSLSLEDARQAMYEADLPFVAVTSDGTFLGLVTEVELAQQASWAGLYKAQMKQRAGG